MGNINEKDSISDGTRLRMKSQGIAHNLFPGAKDGISLQWDIDLERLQGFFKDGTEGLRLIHSAMNFKCQSSYEVMNPR